MIFGVYQHKEINMSTRTMVAVAPEPKPSQTEDVFAFMELVVPKFDGLNFTQVYLEVRNSGWRIGQAFFNFIPGEYQKILSSSPADPFHKDDWDSVCGALDYLLERI